MIINTIHTTQCQPQTIVIGRRGTYDTMQIAFDLSYLVESYGNGVAVLAVKRSQDESAYPAIVTQEDATLLWIVNETDTAYVGSGECQLMWYVDGGLAKTIIYPMVVMRDILQTAEQPPDGYENWIEHLTALGAETLQNAQDAAQSASDAESAKDDAVSAKEAAESAKEAAETAVTHYPKIENNYWMVWDSTSQSYVSTGIQAEGEDGYSPEITITSIAGGHRVIITDKDHPQGQSFDVLDGQGGGGTSDYTDLTNKPQINGHTLTGNQTAEQLDLATPSDIPTDAGDIEYDESATYQAGSVGAELQEQNRQISDLEDTVSTTQIINTASGAIASFDDGADGQPIRKLVAQIEPVQDLHGYENPWPAGGGKNIYNKDADYYGQGKYWDSTTGTLANNPDYYGSPKIPIKADTAYARTTGTTANIFYDANGDYLTTTFTGGAFTSPANASYVAFNVANSINHDTVQLEQGSSLSPYSPYENICPISGHTKMTVTRTGKNLFGGEAFADTIMEKVPGATIDTVNKTVTYSAPNIQRKIIFDKFRPNTQYTIFLRNTGASNLAIDYTDGTRDGITVNGITVTNTSKSVQRIIGEWYTGDTTVYYDDFGIFEGVLTADDFEPYTGNQISVTFPSEAGIVYGGTLTLNPDRTGTLVADRAMVIFDGTQSVGLTNWRTNSTSCAWLYYKSATPRISDTQSTAANYLQNIVCDKLQSVTYAASGYIELYSGEIPCIACVGDSVWGIGMRMTDTSLTTESAINSWLSQNPVTVIYKLAEPQTIQLTAEQVSGILTTLYGTNNIWSSTGDTEVTYPADTKLYIDGKLAEIQATILENIGG